MNVGWCLSQLLRRSFRPTNPRSNECWLLSNLLRCSFRPKEPRSNECWLMSLLRCSFRPKEPRSNVSLFVFRQQKPRSNECCWCLSCFAIRFVQNKTEKQWMLCLSYFAVRFVQKNRLLRSNECWLVFSFKAYFTVFFPMANSPPPPPPPGRKPVSTVAQPWQRPQPGRDATDREIAVPTSQTLPPPE